MTDALRRIASRAPSASAPGPACDLCAAPLEEQHRHLLELPARDITCVCRPCSILFDRDGAAGGRYKVVPERRIALDPGDARWDQLPAPVGLAFYLRRSDTGAVGAVYPSPLGITESEFAVEAWSSLEDAFPVLGTLEQDVEALLSYKPREGAQQMWIVPIDDCYRLAAIVRAHWRGFTGGDQVWDEIGAFFGALGQKEERWATSV